MSTDIAALLRILTAVPQTGATVLGDATPITIPVGLLAAPERFLNASRPLQIAVFLPDLNSLLNSSKITVTSAAGSLQLVLPQNLAPDQKQQLASLAQTQKPLTLAIIPGTNPPQAFLVLPDTNKATPHIENKSQANSPTIGVTTKTVATPVLPANQVIYTATAIPTSGGSPTNQNTSSRIPTPDASQALASKSASNSVGIASPPALPLPPTFRFTIQQVITPQQDLPPLKLNEVIATYGGKTPNAQPVVTIGERSFVLQQNLELPIGSRLIVAFQPADGFQYGLMNKSADDSLSTTLQQVIAALQVREPTIAQQLLQKIPNPQQNLPATLLFFMNALQQGNLSSYIGDRTITGLRSLGRSDLINRLQEESRQTETRMIDPAVGEWRSIQIPLHYFGQFQPMHLFVHYDQQRQQQQADADQRNITRTRFLINFSLTHFGTMQLDGLAQPKQLDLVIRSEQILPSALMSDVKTTYLTMMEAIGFTGGLKFSNDKTGWISPHNHATHATFSA